MSTSEDFTAATETVVSGNDMKTGGPHSSMKTAFSMPSIGGLLDVKSDIDLKSIVELDNDNSARSCDLFVGIHRTVGKVALKRPRLDDAFNEGTVKRYIKEAETWQKLIHANVLQFLGVCEIDSQIHLVSPFAQNGSLSKFIKDNPDVDRVRLLHESADALTYLHASDIIHGDIKAVNILVSDEIHALLCDFGLAKVADSVTATAMRGAGTFRWMAPELWDNQPKTFKSDVYSFGITIAEVLTGTIPFPEYADNSAVMKAVTLNDERPKKPEEFPDTSPYNVAWDVATLSWCTEPSDRLTMADVTKYIDPQGGYTAPLDVSRVSSRPDNGAGQLSPEAVRETVFAGHAAVFIDLMEFHFVTRPHISRQVLILLHEYHVKRRPFYLVYRDMATVVEGHASILGEFACFFPSPSCYALPRDLNRGQGRHADSSKLIGEFRMKPIPSTDKINWEPFSSEAHYHFALVRALRKGARDQPPLPDNVAFKILKEAQIIQPHPSRQLSARWTSKNEDGDEVYASNAELQKKLILESKVFDKSMIDRMGSVQLKTLSKDQGWTTHAHRGSMSWIELGVIDPKKPKDARTWKSHHNEIATAMFKEHIGIEFGPDHEIWSVIKPGDKLGVWIVSIYPGWECACLTAEMHIKEWYLTKEAKEVDAATKKLKQKGIVEWKTVAKAKGSKTPSGSPVKEKAVANDDDLVKPAHQSISEKGTSTANGEKISQKPPAKSGVSKFLDMLLCQSGSSDDS